MAESAHLVRYDATGSAVRVAGRPADPFTAGFGATDLVVGLSAGLRPLAALVVPVVAVRYSGPDERNGTKLTAPRAEHPALTEVANVGRAQARSDVAAAAGRLKAAGVLDLKVPTELEIDQRDPVPAATVTMTGTAVRFDKSSVRASELHTRPVIDFARLGPA